MKKLLTGALLLTFSISSFADCANAYAVKALKRAKSNQVIKMAAVGTGGAVTATALLVTGPGIALLGTFGTVVGTVSWMSMMELTQNNTFYKGLKSIQYAKQGEIPDYLKDKLDKKMSYYSLGDVERNEIDKQIIQTILELNASKELCMDSNGETKPLNLNNFADLIVQKLML